MSQHPSLLGSQKGKRHRSVLKRYEKLKHLMEKNKWGDESSIYHLPKVKSIKFKVKKEKAAATAETQAAAPGQVAAPGQAAPAAGAQTKATGAQPATAKQAIAEKQAPAKDKKAK